MRPTGLGHILPTHRSKSNPGCCGLMPTRHNNKTLQPYLFVVCQILTHNTGQHSTKHRPLILCQRTPKKTRPVGPWWNVGIPWWLTADTSPLHKDRLCWSAVDKAITLGENDQLMPILESWLWNHGNARSGPGTRDSHQPIRGGLCRLSLRLMFNSRIPHTVLFVLLIRFDFVSLTLSDEAKIDDHQMDLFGKTTFVQFGLLWPFSPVNSCCELNLQWTWKGWGACCLKWCWTQSFVWLWCKTKPKKKVAFVIWQKDVVVKRLGRECKTSHWTQFPVAFPSLTPHSHRTRQQICRQICMQTLWCCLQPMWILPFTAVCPIICVCLLWGAPRPVWTRPNRNPLLPTNVAARLKKDKLSGQIAMAIHFLSLERISNYS